MRDFRGYYLLDTQLFKCTCSPYLIAERRIRELTLVLGSLAECCKRQLNQVSFVLLYFRLSTFSDLY